MMFCSLYIPLAHRLSFGQTFVGELFFPFFFLHHGGGGGGSVHGPTVGYRTNLS